MNQWNRIVMQIATDLIEDRKELLLFNEEVSGRKYLSFAVPNEERRKQTTDRASIKRNQLSHGHP
ncbi:hypothetical protein [Pelagicoccus sp. SDUM812002]|uniref:hypothetical protein n=1 Tax=Pelagicoccus sp. SDUM812002 TaxID=3041266 RepID=UPI00280CA913|nr:hypothetical protein [Pelagicoccus sp. SDUM812002]MDQ8184597.1 hypothetical protein [Pelagicoccus sp. SDUM812002]